MSTAIQTIPKSNEVEYVPFGDEAKIKLSVTIIKNFVAINTKTGKGPSDNDCIKFMMLCRSRKLNPFTGDCFLQGYDGRDGAQFSLITAHQAFLKRAEVHPEFDGMDSGVIVKDSNDELQERIGDFLQTGDELMGGWAVVHFKARKHAMKRRLNLSTFNQGFGRWGKDPAGMIVKCAEADALRSSFPTMLGGLYSDTERPVIEVSSVKSPDFGQEHPRGTLPAGLKRTETPEKPTQEPEKQGEDGDLGPHQEPDKAHGASQEQKDGMHVAPEAAGEQAKAAGMESAPVGDFKSVNGETGHLTELRKTMHFSEVSESQVLAFAREKKIAREGQKLSELSEAKIKNLWVAWANVVGEIKAMKV